MRALFVNEDIGGHSTMHSHLLGALTSGHPDVVATVVAAGAPGLGRRVAGAAIPGLAALDADLSALRGQLALSTSLRAKVRQAADADVTHLYTQNAGLLLLGPLGRGPLVVGTDATTAQSGRMLPYRSPGPGTGASIALARRFERRVYARADHLVVHSQWAADSLVREYQIAAQRISVIPYGITVEPIPPGVERSSKPTIGFVGRSMARKGGWELLDAWRSGLRECCNLMLVTPESVPAESGLEVINDISIGDGRINRLMASLAVLAFPSRMDTFGYAAIEAMAMGVPVVAYDFGALAEVVGDGESGAVVPVGDTEALIARLRAYVEDPELARQHGNAARRRVEQRFDAVVTTASLVEVLREAANR